MTIYTIEQKMSGTGTIHDIESDLYDRHLRFRKGVRFAIVFAAYYNRDSIYCTTAAKAAALSHRYNDYSHAIMDQTGRVYIAAYGELRDYITGDVVTD